MCHQHSKTPTKSKSWAIVFLALLIPAGLYFGFQAFTVPIQTPFEYATMADPSHDSAVTLFLSPETDQSYSLSLSQSSWLLRHISQSWFRSILFTLAFLLLMLIVVAVSVAIYIQN